MTDWPETGMLNEWTMKLSEIGENRLSGTKTAHNKPSSMHERFDYEWVWMRQSWFIVAFIESSMLKFHSAITYFPPLLFASTTDKGQRRTSQKESGRCHLLSLTHSLERTTSWIPRSLLDVNIYTEWTSSTIATIFLHIDLLRLKSGKQLRPSIVPTSREILLGCPWNSIGGELKGENKLLRQGWVTFPS